MTKVLSHAKVSMGIVALVAVFVIHAPLFAEVQTGLDVLVKSGFAPLRGKRVGIILNQTSVDAQSRWIVELLRAEPSIQIKALFAPEHGIRGELDRRFGDEQDPGTGIMVYSLYGKTFKPTDEMLRGLDVLVFDLQDVGARYYTYIATLVWVMEAAARNSLPIVVLDRPNLTGAGQVAGGIPAAVDTRRHTSIFPIPTRHGMTIGELAAMFNEHFGIHAALQVIPMAGFRRDVDFESMGLPWVNPSPNIRSIETARLYVNLGILESANLSVGRGTDRPFFLYGAPWIDSKKWLERIAARGGLEGLAVKEAHFSPTTSVYAGKVCHGLEVAALDRSKSQSYAAAIVLLQALAELYPKRLNLAGTWQMSGDRRFPGWIRAQLNPREILERWDQDIAADFSEVRKQYLRY